MEIGQFVGKGMEGGFVKRAVHLEQKPSGRWYFFSENENEGSLCDFSLMELILKPSFWKAVGKAEGWKDGEYNGGLMGYGELEMHCMLDALWNGETIEEYIKTL